MITYAVCISFGRPGMHQVMDAASFSEFFASLRVRIRVHITLEQRTVFLVMDVSHREHGLNVGHELLDGSLVVAQQSVLNSQHCQ